MHRKDFIRLSGAVTAGLATSRSGFARFASYSSFPEVRVPVAERKFISQSVEQAILSVQKKIGDRELAWLFNNCFPNTLDTTVEFTT
ncbi:MAG TPA: hypothetical protein VK644_01970, partial [Chitinophagaceae bacterium]|nr:hypothetical protein [Chitinophagaceae bacterium]